MFPGDAFMRLRLPSSFHAFHEVRVRKFLFDEAGRLRNGWWALAFVACVAATSLAYTPLSHRLQAMGVSKDWLQFAPVAMVLLATWICTRLRRESLSSVGLRLDRRWAREFAWGCGIGFAAMALVASLLFVSGGVHFVFDPARSLRGMAFGVYTFLSMALLEELLFRGFLFQRLVAGLGAWPAQMLLAALFALAHWGNPGMEGATKIWATVDIAIAAVFLGLAYLRTRSLALPIGLHLGWNWTQGDLFGFGVSGTNLVGWLHPVFQRMPAWITGGKFGPEGSLVGVAVDLVTLAVIWNWPSTRAQDGRNEDATTPGSAQRATIRDATG